MSPRVPAEKNITNYAKNNKKSSVLSQKESDMLYAQNNSHQELA